MNALVGHEVALYSSIAAVIEAGRAASARYWVPATSGNFSVRANPRLIAITRSGVDKGALQSADILAQRIDEPLQPGSSAEAGLHVRLYLDNPEIGAIFHVHSPAATVLGRAHAGDGAILIEGWELQKALRGVRSHEQVVEAPVFANDQNVPELAERVAAALGQPARPNVLRAPGYLLAGHGLYAWGSDSAEAWRHLEALETLFQQISNFRSYRP
jgi:methylthioribulose-1-phosphate dehydratase